MGRLFTYEQIETGLVPTPEDFVEAKDVFIASTEAEIEKGTVTGAFIYGSVAVGLANKRSDFDAFIALDDEKGSYNVARELVQSINTAKIPFGPIVQTNANLSSAHHEMDRYFGAHLKSTDRAVIGEDPADYIQFTDYPADEIMAAYLAQKKRRLINTFTAVSPLEVQEGGLQRMLELPVAVGRKALQALAETGHIDAAVKKTADKKQVMRSFIPLLDEINLKGEAKRLVDANNLYNMMLDKAVDGGSEFEYNNGLRVIHSYLPKAIEWVEKLEDFLLPELKT